jgi:putative salt-induced outer membrane protein
MSARFVVLACVASTVATVPARAELPGPVRAMIESAMRTDDAKAVAAVVKAAKETQPQDSGEIDAMKQKFDDTHNLVTAEKARLERERLLAARPLELWKGETEIGAFNSTGNTRNAGISAGLKLERIGVYWQHKLQLNLDYQKTNGDVSREQYLAAYSPRYQLRDQFYVYGLVQYERDRFQGYRNRYSLSPGFGYHVFDRPDLKLAVEAGPAVRFTDFVDEPSKTTASGLGSLDFAWKPSQTIKLTQVASAYVESDNSTFISTTALEAGMVKGLKARLSYRYEHDTDPPDNTRRTDSLSRFTLVYGF